MVKICIAIVTEANLIKRFFSGQFGGLIAVLFRLLYLFFFGAC